MKKIIFYFKKELKNNLFDYLFLITAGIFFIVAVNLFKGERFFQFIILLAFTAFYILWGIYHHISEDSLHLKTVIEYVLIGFTLIFLLKIVILP